MAKVFKNIYRLKNGIRKTSKTYYFKATVDGKRRSINTGSANRKEAEKKALEFFETGQLPKPTMYKPNTIVAIIEELNWLIPAKNPKYLLALTEKRNYGLNQAKNIASAFKHMFNKIEYLDNWHTFIRRKRILKNASFEYYTDFISKPAHTLTYQDAINFITFLEEYTAYLKENKMPRESKFFMRQNRMNLIALRGTFKMRNRTLLMNKYAL